MRHCAFVIAQVESVKDVPALVKVAHREKVRLGIALNPRTPLKRILPYLKDIDYVLVMSVNPGKQGQPFQPSALKKVRVLRRRFPTLRIGIDGGIRDGTAQRALKAGVSDLIVGSAIFGQPAPQKAFVALKAKLA
jgi:ribulose-phosphate 3-epimerase